MVVYSICYFASFLLARAGWYAPSGLVLLIAALWLYWRDYRQSGNLIHLRGLFCLGFVGGQGLSCMKLSHLAEDWAWMTWLCFFFAGACFYLAFSRTVGGRKKTMDAGPFARRLGRGQAGLTVRFTAMSRERARLEADSGGLLLAIVGITGVSAAAFCLEAAVLGYIPFFVRGVPHAYSYFHISGVHYFTVSCVLSPPLAVLYFLGKNGRRSWKDWAAAISAAISLAIPVLCVSRFQLIFSVGLSVLSYIAVKRQFRLAYVGILAAVMIPAYVILTIARSHDVAYLNGIFEMKNSAMPIFITQPYMYVANNYDNFNCLVEQLPAHTLGLRMLFPLWALTGLKFLYPNLAAFPIYVTKEELTTVTLFYDAYYDFGLLGVMVLAAALGWACGRLEKRLKTMQNPAGYLLYAQMAMYMSLSFFTTWFSNPTTWFYFAATGAVWFCTEYVRGRE